MFKSSDKLRPREDIVYFAVGMALFLSNSKEASLELGVNLKDGQVAGLKINSTKSEILGFNLNKTILQK